MRRITDEDVEILARTLYGEARGEYGRTDGGLAALIAVGNVVMNRVKKGGWFGKNIKDVCLKPFQFSCWNEGDPNANRLKDPRPFEGTVFDACVRTAQGVTSGIWPDITKGSDHYHADYCGPKWAKDRLPLLRLGHHIFYKLEG